MGVDFVWAVWDEIQSHRYGIPIVALIALLLAMLIILIKTYRKLGDRQ